MLTRWRLRYAVAWPWVSESLVDVADQTSSVPITSTRPTATMSVQSMPGVRQPGAVGRDGRVIGSPFPFGGRIEPSEANTGSPAGGVVPGITARFGFTSMPLTP